MLLLYSAVLFHLHQNKGFGDLSQRLPLLLPAVFFKGAGGLGVSALSKDTSLPRGTQENCPTESTQHPLSLFCLVLEVKHILSAGILAQGTWAEGTVSLQSWA